MTLRFTSSYICSPCLKSLRRCFSLAAASIATRVPPGPPPSLGVANLSPARRLVALYGVDAPKYLQGITTTNIPLMQHTHGSYSAILNAQGRVLFDIFIYPVGHSPAWRLSIGGTTDPAFFLECDASMADALVAHINKYKLRSKFTLRRLEPGEWDLWGLWDDRKGGEHDYCALANAGPAKDYENLLREDSIGCYDRRASPHFCTRLVLPNGETPETADPGFAVTNMVDTDVYHLRRYLRGVSEGAKEIIPGAALPLESNMDYMGGIDFRKGCYVGQELTIRTHHRGVVRKRILPVQIYPEDNNVFVEQEMPIYNAEVSLNNKVLREAIIPSDVGANIVRDISGEPENMKSRTRSAGKFLANIGNVGLALCRLEQMVVPAEEDRFYLEWSGRNDRENDSQYKVRVKAFVPPWHMIGGMEPNPQSRGDTSIADH